jgi:ferredoxin
MAIPTSRTKEPGKISIDRNRCTGCGKCVAICGDNSLELFEGYSRQSSGAVFGCIGCGQCMAVCPEEAIKIHGRFLSPDDLFPLPLPEEKASYHSLTALMQRRRSIRKFRSTPVEQSLIEEVLAAAQTAPMGLPPSDVCVKVWDTREKVHEFTVDYCNYLEKMKWFFSPFFLSLMKFFWGKENDELFRNFLRPLVARYTGAMKGGENTVTYDAPVAMYFYGTPWSDPADPIIAATYAMLAAESLGLGTCMLGAIHPFIQSGKAGERFRKRHGIRYKSKEGLFLIMGYPKAEFLKGINRGFAHIDQPGNN